MFDELGKGYFSFGLPVGSGKASDTTLGNKSLRVLGTTAGFVTRIVQTPEGRMRVRTKNGMPEFLMENFSDGTEYSLPPKKQPIIFYMSSGAYDTGSYNLSNHALTSNFTLYKSEAVQALDTSAFDTNLMPIARPLNGELSKLYTQAVLGADTLTVASLAVSVTNPSQFTGLARRLMQGRYGAGNYNPQIGALMMNAYFGDTCGLLYFSEPNEYWLVRLLQETTGLVITGYKLTIHADLQPLLDAARANSSVANATAAIETLALAWAKNLQTTATDIATFSMPDGEPVAHSWNFSLRSNKADCVVRVFAGYGYDRHTYHHMRLNFSWVNGSPSATLQIVEVVDGWLYCAKSPIWAPLGLDTKWLNVFPTSPKPTSNQNCPIYAYYLDDTLDVVRWHFNEVDNGAFNHDARALAQYVAETQSVFGEGSVSYAWDYRYGTAEEYGFASSFADCRHNSPSNAYIGSGTINSTYTSTPPSQGALSPWWYGSVAYAEFALSGSHDTSANPRLPVLPQAFANGTNYSIRDGLHYGNGTITGAIVTQYREDGDVSGSHVSAVIFAVNDPCTVYFAKSTELNGARSTNQETRELGRARVDEWELLNYGGTVGGVWAGPVTRQICAANITLYTNLLSASTGTDSSTIRSRSIKVVAKGVAQEVWAGDSPIFYPSNANPILPLPIRAISSSVFNDGRFTSGNLQQDVHATLNGYPTTIDAFVGVS